MLAAFAQGVVKWHKDRKKEKVEKEKGGHRGCENTETEKQWKKILNRTKDKYFFKFFKSLI